MIIGIVGPLDSSEKIRKYLEKINTSLEARLYIREKTVNAIEVIEACENECDVIIFTGCGVYEAVSSKYNIKKPNVFVSRGGSSILKAFCEATNDNISLEKLSIDVVETEILEDILDEMDMNSKEIFSLPFSNEIDEMEYVNWHINLFKEKKIDVMFTGFGAVYNELKKKGYPVFRLEATRPQIKVCYEKLKSEYALNKAQYSQIAVEILNLTDYKGNKENYYSNMIKKSDIDKVIVEYVRGIQGSLFNFGRDEYVIFAHKGAIENDKNYEELLKLQKNVKKIGFYLSVGIGIGTTAYQAEANGYKALKRCTDSKEYGMFSIDEYDVIKGPLGLDNELSYSLVASDEYIIEVSEKTGLSCESIAKIMAISETRKSKIYDTKELADYLDMSERSARRILNKITSTDFGRIYAKESSNGGGRPKNIIEILF